MRKRQIQPSVSVVVRDGQLDARPAQLQVGGQMDAKSSPMCCRLTEEAIRCELFRSRKSWHSAHRRSWPSGMDRPSRSKPAFTRWHDYAAAASCANGAMDEAEPRPHG